MNAVTMVKFETGLGEYFISLSPDREVVLSHRPESETRFNEVRRFKADSKTELVARMLHYNCEGWVGTGADVEQYATILRQIRGE